ncbi:MAG: ABC transporter substrate-binding protein [Verrucomicrobia bacterium]|nr:ABC transporter substrate-binding protein [Verrucomicrobiota bacterium]
MAPSITEILFAMNMGDHLMAVTDFCDYPEEARVLRSAGRTIGRMDQPDFEQFAVLRPDLILATDLTPPDVIARLHQPPRIQVAGLRHASLEGLFAEIAFLGRITGVPSLAAGLLRDLRARRSAVESAIRALNPQTHRSAILLLGIEDDLQPGWSPGANTWPDDLLSIAQTENLARQLGQSWGQVSFEALLKFDPEVIIVGVGASSADQQRFQQQLLAMQTHPVWRRLQAVRTNRVHAIPSEDLNIPGPRMLTVLEAIAETVWPEAFQQQD